MWRTEPKWPFWGIFTTRVKFEKKKKIIFFFTVSKLVWLHIFLFSPLFERFLAKESIFVGTKALKWDFVFLFLWRTEPKWPFWGIFTTRVKFKKKKKIIFFFTVSKLVWLHIFLFLPLFERFLAKESIFVGTKALKWDFVFLFLWRTEPKWPFWGIFTTRVKFKRKKKIIFFFTVSKLVWLHIFLFSPLFERFLAKESIFVGTKALKWDFVFLFLDFVFLFLWETEPKWPFWGIFTTRVKFEKKKKIIFFFTVSKLVWLHIFLFSPLFERFLAKESIFVGTKALFLKKMGFCVFIFVKDWAQMAILRDFYHTCKIWKKKKNYFFLHGFQISLASHIFIFTTFWEIFGKRIDFCGDQSTKMGFCVFIFVKDWAQMAILRDFYHTCKIWKKKKIIFFFTVSKLVWLHIFLFLPLFETFLAKESIFVGTKALKWDFVFLFLWRTEPKWPFWGIFTTRVKFKKKKKLFFSSRFPN